MGPLAVLPKDEVESKARRDSGRTTHCARHRQDRERGAAAIEVAFVLPVIALFLLGLMTAYTALFAKLDCTYVAGTIARAVARGEAAPAVGSEILPEGSEVNVEHDGELVRVTVRMRVHLLMLSGLMVEERAVAMAEPEPGDGP
ncbi:TadE family type IV pilus minor pilin [Dactylosporangium sp. CA-092794]|uniref:TadE family type IV pilus minor pilin n=1 Tax=Dactylosporangium sp. CA-092794 TaxID=3239929 RepID=UPI003D94F225